MKGLEGNVLITGGSGTLGKTILTLAREEKWDCRFTIYSRSELLQAQMRSRFPEHRYILGDVRDYNRLEAAIAGHDLVIHAAAMKRIPECEEAPSECWKTNILGSQNVAAACRANNIKKCVGISTDKACRASTVYGASKLVLERIFMSSNGRCEFTAVRYGNVVSSRGSVIPIWRSQCQKGLPITVTDKSMTRFWMSPTSAAQLVVQAASEDGGTILVPKLLALSLEELAKIIAPNSRIIEVGLRSLEKKHEDLVHPDETAEEHVHTYHLVEDGSRGHVYNSGLVSHLTAQQFNEMVADAEKYEK